MRSGCSRSRCDCLCDAPSQKLADRSLSPEGRGRWRRDARLRTLGRTPWACGRSTSRWSAPVPAATSRPFGARSSACRWPPSRTTVRAACCLNWGCIPTKALLRNAEVVGLFQRAEEFGIAAGDWRADYAHAVQRSRRVADRMARGVEFLFRKNKITLVPGVGSLKARNVVEVKGAGRHRTRGGEERHPGHGVGAAVDPGRGHRREAGDLLQRGRPQRSPGRRLSPWSERGRWAWSSRTCTPPTAPG